MVYIHEFQDWLTGSKRHRWHMFGSHHCKIRAMSYAKGCNPMNPQRIRVGDTVVFEVVPTPGVNI